MIALNWKQGTGHFTFLMTHSRKGKKGALCCPGWLILTTIEKTAFLPFSVVGFIGRELLQRNTPGFSPQKSMIQSNDKLVETKLSLWVWLLHFFLWESGWPEQHAFCECCKGTCPVGRPVFQHDLWLGGLASLCFWGSYHIYHIIIYDYHISIS